MDPIRDSLGENLWVIDHEELVVLTIRHIRGRLLAINQELKRRMAQHQTAPTPADIIDLTNDDSKVNLYSLLVVDLCAGFFSEMVLIRLIVHLPWTNRIKNLSYYCVLKKIFSIWSVKDSYYSPYCYCIISLTLG